MKCSKKQCAEIVHAFERGLYIHTGIIGHDPGILDVRKA